MQPAQASARAVPAPPFLLTPGRVGLEAVTAAECPDAQPSMTESATTQAAMAQAATLAQEDFSAYAVAHAQMHVRCADEERKLVTPGLCGSEHHSRHQQWNRKTQAKRAHFWAPVALWIIW